MLQHPTKIESNTNPNQKKHRSKTDKEGTNETDKADTKENIRLISTDKNYTHDGTNTACHICGQICKTVRYHCM